MGSETGRESIVITNKPWGHEELLLKEGEFGFKKLVVNPGKSTSYQYHNHKNELFYVESGTATLRLEDREKILNAGKYIYLKAGTKHQTINNGSEDVIILGLKLNEWYAYHIGFPFKYLLPTIIIVTVIIDFWKKHKSI